MNTSIRRYAALGDSLSEGFSDWGRVDRSIGFTYILAGLLREKRPELEWTNLGVSGARAADVLRGQVDRALAFEPDLITLVVGANDVPVTPPEEFRRVYGELLSRLRRGTSGILAVANLPDFFHLLPPQFAAYRGALEQRTHDYNRIIAESAAAQGALLVDLFSSHEAQDPRNLSGDGLHPNARGYRIMARIFAETLNQAGFELALPEIDL
jgi:lysophospholipase L1-like esterase